MEGSISEQFSPLARLKAQQEAIQAQIQEARKPSGMLFQLVETTSPDNSIQHNPDLANEYDALFLTRQGNQAIVGYLIQRPVSYAEKEEKYREQEEFKKLGIFVDSAVKDQPWDTLNYSIAEGKEPSVSISKIELNGDPRFTIDGDEPELGVILVVMQVNLDDLKDPLAQKILNFVARYDTATAYLPKQFVINDDPNTAIAEENKRIAEELLKENPNPDEQLKEVDVELRKLLEGRNELPGEELMETMDETYNKWSAAMDKTMRYRMVLAGTPVIPKVPLGKFPFSAIKSTSLIMKAIEGIADRYSDTKFYYGEKPSK